MHPFDIIPVTVRRSWGDIFTKTHGEESVPPAMSLTIPLPLGNQIIELVFPLLDLTHEFHMTLLVHIDNNDQ
jgi:hypothetical protein